MSKQPFFKPDLKIYFKKPLRNAGRCCNPVTLKLFCFRYALTEPAAIFKFHRIIRFKTIWPLFYAGSFLFIILCSFVSISYAEDGKLLDAKGPIVITASTLTADNKAHTALFEGSVVAKTENMTIYSDKMLVYYTEDGKIIKIDADGNVKLIRGERVITSGAATYIAGDEKAIFTGQPKAMDGGSVVTGTKMIYMMKEDRSIVENSRVFIDNRKGK